MFKDLGSAAAEVPKHNPNAAKIGKSEVLRQVLVQHLCQWYFYRTTRGGRSPLVVGFFLLRSRVGGFLGGRLRGL